MDMVNYLASWKKKQSGFMDKTIVLHGQNNMASFKLKVELCSKAFL